MSRRFSAWRTRADLTLDEVVDAADALLREVAPRQTRYAVAERPDVRTVRYYTTRGLLPKPLSYDGGRARYGFSHLVRLLAIKRMQADHFTLDQIARALAHKNDDEVVLLIERSAPAFDTVPASRAADTVPPMRASPSDELALLSPRAQAAPVPFARADEGRDVGAALTLDLLPGGKLVIAPDVVGDPKKREQLAKNLEELARFVRAMQTDKEENGGGDV